jgi:hypothetical protein
VQSEEERDVEIETASEMKGTKQEQEGSIEEDLSPSFFSEERADPNKIDETEEIRVNRKEDEVHSRFLENRDPFFKEKPLVNLLFDSKRWNRPFRYIKNTYFDGTVRNEMSQYFFDICKSDGKERISFTYPPSLSVFFEMIKRRISPPTFEKSSPKKLWLYTKSQ